MGSFEESIKGKLVEEQIIVIAQQIDVMLGVQSNQEESIKKLTLKAQGLESKWGQIKIAK